MAQKPARIYLFTHPRVASNLMVKILNIKEQNIPSSENGGYFFQAPVFKAIELKLRHKPITTWPEADLAVIRELYEKSFSDLEKWLDEAEKNNQIAFIKEHALFMADPVSITRYRVSQHRKREGADVSTETGSELSKQWQLGGPSSEAEVPTPSPLNRMLFSDDFLLSFTPSFLIRHPALVFPSYLRAYVGEDMPKTNTDASALVIELDHSMSFHWMRTLYDFYISKGIKPLVLDADDVISSQQVLIDYAKQVGLDAEKLHWDWAPANAKDVENHLDARSQRFWGTILNSSGVMNDKMAKNLDTAVEKKKWSEEFGELIGESMADWVEAAMEDYGYLKERRLRPSST